MKRLMVCLLVLGWAGAQEASEHVLVQAHRGYSEIYPENTLLSIDKAFEVGADRVETDLALTSDGHLVLMHDRTVERTTDGEGAVQFMTLEQVKALDAGSWKSPEFAGERVPTLIEALELAEGRGELNLEIKVNGRSGSYVSEVIRAAVETVHEQDAADRVIFSSFDFQALQQVKELDPELRVLLIDWDEASESFDWLDVAVAQGFYGWSPTSEYATPDRLRRAEEAGIFVHIGAGPGPKLLEWVELGVDGFSSNDPAALIEFLERRGLR
ncbi:MAG TPA: glycerophosphodiester phosphodiesterase family protein [Trueperaceae bacterium]